MESWGKLPLLLQNNRVLPLRSTQLLAFFIQIKNLFAEATYLKVSQVFTLAPTYTPLYMALCKKYEANTFGSL